MPSQNPKTIALLTTWLDGWYQSDLWRATVAAAKERGCRAIALVNYAAPGAEAPSGPEGIWGLACRGEIHGVLFSSGPMSRWEGEGVLCIVRDWLFPKPAVSLGFRVPHLDSVVPAGTGVGDLVLHLVKEHGCRRIGWIAGPHNNQDALQRLQAFQEGMKRAGIFLDESWMEEGEFTLEGGQRAAICLLDRHPEMDALVAANDAMAIGAMSVAASRGIDVPNQLRIVGFDDSLEAADQTPPLTTIRNPVKEIANRGMQLCLERMRAPHKAAVTLEEPVRPVFRESCGCMRTPAVRESESMSQERLAQSAEFQVRIQAESPRFMAWFRKVLSQADLDDYFYWESFIAQEFRSSGVRESLLDASSILTEFICTYFRKQKLKVDGMIRDMHRLSSAMLGNPEPEHLLANLAESLRGWCHHGFRLLLFDAAHAPASRETNFGICDFARKLEWKDSCFHPFPEVEDLLPEAMDAGDCWIAVPLEHADMRFGLVLLQGWNGMESFVEPLRRILSMALVDSWRTRSERALQDRLRQLIARDSQTQLWNRLGFLEAGHQMAAQAFREKRNVGILLLEIEQYQENLQKYGKEDTALALRIISEAFRECFRSSDVLARIEEPVFVALFVIQDRADHMLMLSRVQKSILQHAEKRLLPWRISTRMGWTIWDGMDGSSLKAQLETALERARGNG